MSAAMHRLTEAVKSAHKGRTKAGQVEVRTEDVAEALRVWGLYEEAAVDNVRLASEAETAKADALAEVHARAAAERARDAARKERDAAREAAAHPSDRFLLEADLVACAAGLKHLQDATTRAWERNERSLAGVLGDPDAVPRPVWEAVDANGRPLLADVLAARAQVLVALKETRRDDD